MSTDLIVPANVSSALAARLGRPSTISDDMVSGIGGGFKRLTKRGGRLRIKDGKEETTLPNLTAEVVIVGASPGITKIFYKGSYASDGSNDRAPDCYSNDGIRPAADVEDRQSDLCANCPQNAWDSKIVDGKGMKACRDEKRLALIFPNSANLDNPDVYLYTVTPSELTAFRQYGEALNAKGWAPEYVITKLSFDTKANHPKLQFSFANFISDELLPTIDRLVGSKKVLDILGTPVMAARDEGPAQPRKPGVRVVEDEEVEVIVEPKIASIRQTNPKPEPVLEAKVVNSSRINSDIQNIINELKLDEEDE